MTSQQVPLSTNYLPNLESFHRYQNSEDKNRQKSTSSLLHNKNNNNTNIETHKNKSFQANLRLFSKSTNLTEQFNIMCSQNPGMKAFQASILNQQMYASQNNLNSAANVAGSRTNLAGGGALGQSNLNLSALGAAAGQGQQPHSTQQITNLVSPTGATTKTYKSYKSKAANSHAGSKLGLTTTAGAAAASSNSSNSRTGITLAGNYKLFYKIGSGSFGEIYLALNLKTNTEVAVKVEPMSSRPQSLPYEAKVYQRIQSGEGIPKVHYFGAERSRDLHVLVMDLLGPSLEDLFKFCGRKLSYKTTIMLADQMISRVEWLHSKNLIHRDIKPDNFMMGIGAHCNTVFLADYGLAKRYRNSVGKHIKYRDDKSLTGTARYASVNTHYGSEQSRRDDLESLGYVLVYFMKGKLPWQNLKNKDRTKNRYEAIAEKKLTTSIPTLWVG